jgi:iron complex transport system ATP-binding protein
MEIEAKGIAIRFGPMALLEGVDLAMRGGEMVGLIGPNGSGKTTLLRVLANLRAPEAGRVHYAGRTAAEIGTRELSRQIAYLAQGGAVHWPMRVETLVALGRLPHRRPFQGLDAADRHAIEQAMTAADIGSLRARTMGQVSGGERMRVLLARALAVDARVLLADEPIAALDPLHQLQVMALLEGVDLAMRGGEMVGLIGPNGSGKTTLLRVLANLRAPEAGRVHYAGRTAAEIGTRELSRQIAYLAQGGAVHWPMRVETLVALGRLPHRRPFQGLDAADRHAIEQAMTAADIGSLRARTMGQVSGGERMRVLLARALAVDARVLLADEPIAALDPLHQLQVMALLRTIASEGRGVIVVLHDLALATRFCDRLILLARGGILVEGAPARVLTDAHVAEAYGVEVVRGERDGVPFLLPWKPSAKSEGEVS